MVVRGEDERWRSKNLRKKTERPKCDDCVSRADVLKYKCDCYDAQNHLLYAVPTGHIMRLPSVAPERKRVLSQLRGKVERQ